MGARWWEAREDSKHSRPMRETMTTTLNYTNGSYPALLTRTSANAWPTCLPWPCCRGTMTYILPVLAHKEGLAPHNAEGLGEVWESGLTSDTGMRGIESTSTRGGQMLWCML